MDLRGARHDRESLCAAVPVGRCVRIWHLPAPQSGLPSPGGPGPVSRRQPPRRRHPLVSADLVDPGVLRRGWFVARAGHGRDGRGRPWRLQSIEAPPGAGASVYHLRRHQRRHGAAGSLQLPFRAHAAPGQFHRARDHAVPRTRLGARAVRGTDRGLPRRAWTSLPERRAGRRRPLGVGLAAGGLSLLELHGWARVSPRRLVPGRACKPFGGSAPTQQQDPADDQQRADKARQRHALLLESNQPVLVDRERHRHLAGHNEPRQRGRAE